MSKNSELQILGQNIRKVRRGLKLSQEDLADRCDLHRTYICDVERGARNVTFGTLLRLARGLDMPVSELIRTGKMDFLLLLPVNTRFIVSLRQVDLGGFVNALFGLCVMIYAAGKLHLHPSAMQIIGFTMLCGVGILIHYSLMFMLASVGFWTVRAQGIVWGYYNLFNIARMPDEAFRGAYKAMFTFVLPVLLVSNVPVRLLADKALAPVFWLSLLALGLIWALLSEWFWRVSVRRYTSASS